MRTYFLKKKFSNSALIVSILHVIPQSFQKIHNQKILYTNSSMADNQSSTRHFHKEVRIWGCTESFLKLTEREYYQSFLQVSQRFHDNIYVHFLFPCEHLKGKFFEIFLIYLDL